MLEIGLMLNLALLCAGCHGGNGEGRPEAGYPRLAAQPAAYLERQLEAYADGRRKSVVMTPLARSLSSVERRQLARDYAARVPGSMRPPASKSERGEALARSGDAALRVQACQNCHGALGHGQAPSGPSLAAQPPEFLRAELRAWRDGTRASDPTGQMPLIARALREDDLRAVVDYYAGLPPPPGSRDGPQRQFSRTAPETRPDIGGDTK